MGKLEGRVEQRLENMQFRKSKMGFMTMGTLDIHPDGIAFYKAKGALAGRALFGMLGAAATKGNTGREPEAAFTFAEIQNARYDSIMMTPTIIIDLKNGGTVFFSTQSRMFNGKSTLMTAADYIRSKLV
jgi:hypothetical protein